MSSILEGAGGPRAISSVAVGILNTSYFRPLNYKCMQCQNIKSTIKSPFPPSFQSCSSIPTLQHAHSFSITTLERRRHGNLQVCAATLRAPNLHYAIALLILFYEVEKCLYVVLLLCLIRFLDGDCDFKRRVGTSNIFQNDSLKKRTNGF